MVSADEMLVLLKRLFLKWQELRQNVLGQKRLRTILNLYVKALNDGDKTALETVCDLLQDCLKRKEN